MRRTGYFTVNWLGQNINGRKDRAGKWAVGFMESLDSGPGLAMISLGNCGQIIESVMGGSSNYLTGHCAHVLEAVT